MCQCDIAVPALGNCTRKSFHTGWNVHTRRTDKGDAIENGGGIKHVQRKNYDNNGKLASDPSIYTMNHPDLIISNLMENSIGL